MSQEKIEKLLEVLKDLPFSQWEIVKREIDRLYDIQRQENVPNCELEAFKEYLQHWVENLSKYKKHTIQEFKELINNKTSVEATTDEMLSEKQLEQINKYLANKY